MGVENVGGNKYTFNGVSYDNAKDLAVNVGVYTLTNVPANHPIGFGVAGTDVLEVTGGTLEGTATVDGVAGVEHYSGTVTFEVKQDFSAQPLSYSCLNHGYMGRQGRLVFSERCSTSQTDCDPEAAFVEVTGLAAGASATLTVTTTRTGYVGGSAATTASAAAAPGLLSVTISDSTYDGSGSYPNGTFVVTSKHFQINASDEWESAPDKHVLKYYPDGSKYTYIIAWNDEEAKWVLRIYGTAYTPVAEYGGMSEDAVFVAGASGNIGEQHGSASQYVTTESYTDANGIDYPGPNLSLIHI